MILLCASVASAQILDIPDPIFKQALLDLGLDTNGDSEIQNSEAEAVIELNLKSLDIQSLEGIRSFLNLKELNADNNELTELDLTDLNLVNITARNNDLSIINISSCTDLTQLDLENNNLSELDISNSKSLINLYVDRNNLSELDETSLDSITWLDIKLNNFEELDFSNMKNLQWLFTSHNNFKSLDLRNQTKLTFFGCGYNPELNELLLTPTDFLLTLNIQNTLLENLDLSQFPSLHAVVLNNLLPQTFILNQNPELRELSIKNNNLTTIDLSNLPNLTDLDISENPIQDLELSNLTNLKVLIIENCTELNSLDLSSNQQLVDLDISHTNFEEITGTQFENLIRYTGEDSKIKNLDFSASSKLVEVLISPSLEILLAKNGSNEEINTRYSPDPYQLKYICLDEDHVLATIDDLSYVDFQSQPLINSYCSFVSGSAIYSITGQNTLDHNMNGCDENDFFIPHLKYDINNTQGVQGAIITDDSGTYSIDLQEETHTITPRFENPDYFSSDPQSIVVDFPTEASPYSQDFCITPIGEKDDLEVVIFSSTDIRPGFNGEYTIIYTNKGNTIQSGDVRLSFQMNKMELDSLSQNIDFENTNSIGWEFENLLPLESREITVIFEFNTPMDDNPINGGDELIFRATINPVDNDLTISDNFFLYKQIAVNSFDPNDKTCLQGECLDLEKVGDYVHYMVRFENTGTANAINVVVVDTLDETKFDIPSLQVIDASHNIQTAVRNNIAQFHFKNIQLPFDDENNDGYVVFKIKTLETLVLGDAFANSAAIYFDFNFPIITNNYLTTVIQIVDEDNDGFNEEDDCDDNNADINPLAEEIPGNGIDENCNGEDLLSSINELEQYNIEIFPNPNNGEFRINVEEDIKIIIFDVNGKILIEKEVAPGRNSLSIEDAQAGLYFIKFLQEGELLGHRKLIIQ